jgi:tripartite-type tricarboxylate transporter receptor subunit TctC
MKRSLSRGRSWRAVAALTLTAGLAAACGTSNAASSDSGGSGSGSSFYQGKTLSVVVPYGPGGGYDQWARVLSPYLKKYLGVSDVKVVNAPGGGGLIGTGQIYHAAPDGLTIGDTNAGGDVFDQMDNATGYNVDVTKFNWIGRPDDDPHVIATRDPDHLTFDKIVDSKKQIKALATGKGSSDYNSAVILYNAFKVPFQMVAAFSGSSEEKAAFLSGEGTTSSLSASDIAAIKGKASPVVVVSAKPFDKLPQVPTIVDEAQKHNLSSQTIDALKGLTDVMDLGHAFFAPPGVPADRVEALRTAFQKAMNDKDLLAAADKAGLYPGYESGDDLTAATKDALAQKDLFTNLLKSGS